MLNILGDFTVVLVKGGFKVLNELENKIKFHYEEISDCENTVMEMKISIKEHKKAIKELEKIQTKLADLYV